MKRVILQLLNKIYPSFCLYCQKELSDSFDILCRSCMHTLQLAYHDPSERLVYCFEYHSAAQALLQAFESSRFSKLKDLMVSFMVMKFLKLNCIVPDVIIPAIQDGFSNPENRALTKAFAKMLGTSCINALKFELDPMVYDEQGKLLGAVVLRTNAMRALTPAQHILILDGYEYTPELYHLVFTRYPHSRYLSLSGPKIIV